MKVWANKRTGNLGMITSEAGRVPWAGHRPLLMMGPPRSGVLRVPAEAGGVCGVVRLSPPVY